VYKSGIAIGQVCLETN